MQTATLHEVMQRSFSRPDEVKTFEKGRVELLRFGETVVGRATLQPGWRWSLHVKPTVGTEWCEATHFGYLISGRLHVKMADGKEFEIGPGEVAYIPPEHEAWVVGKEPAVLVDWQGFASLSKA